MRPHENMLALGRGKVNSKLPLMKPELGAGFLSSNNKSKRQCCSTIPCLDLEGSCDSNLKLLGSG